MGIQKNLTSKGLESVSVSFSTSEVTFSSKRFTIKDVELFIKKLGYGIQSSENDHNYSIQEKLFLFCLVFTLPLFSHMFLKGVAYLQDPFIQFLLCLPVYLLGTWFFGKSAISSIKNNALNMDVLITIGSSAAFFYSVYGWYLHYGTEQVHKFLFFETSATIITLVLLGNVLENRSVKQTTSSIKELAAIKIVKAKIETDNGIQEVDFEDIKVGDILLVNSGDKIAVDGKIINGSGSVDESMITGESVPVTKLKNDKVIGGTILFSGNITVMATNVGNDTLLSNIIDLVKNAQNNKPRIQKLGDKVSAIFVPIVLLISLITFLLSYYVFSINSLDSFLRSIAVLVISCPCAMGLATPTAVMVGIGRAAKRGILIKGGDTLEKLGRIKEIYFDKTGTITTGKFKIKNINVISGEEQDIKNIIYSLEIHSSHPIAISLTNELSIHSKRLNITDIHEEKGISISGKINEDIYMIGSKKITSVQNNENDLYLTKNNNLIATIDIQDEIKKYTFDVIKELKKNRIKTNLLSGDKKEKCELISQQLSLDKIFYEQLPSDKLNKIKMSSERSNIAMVGDGVNDAPALSQATIGISLGGATQIAMQSSDVILLNKKNLKQLPKALSISRHTFLTIKQNLFWAFAYNIVAIPIAAMGYLNPMWGALFMAFSDVIVIGNSIRLKYKKLN